MLYEVSCEPNFLVSLFPMLFQSEHHPKLLKMKLFISSLSLLPVVLAQYNYGGNSASSSMSAASTSPTSTSSASSSIQTIAVGQNGLKFSPNSLVVAPGRQVVFQFYPGGHSVTQSSFDAPCVPLNATSLFSGFINSSGGPAVGFLSPLVMKHRADCHCA